MGKFGMRGGEIIGGAIAGVEARGAMGPVSAARVVTGAGGRDRGAIVLATVGGVVLVVAAHGGRMGVDYQANTTHTILTEYNLLPSLGESSPPSTHWLWEGAACYAR